MEITDEIDTLMFEDNYFLDPKMKFYEKEDEYDTFL
jgi:hypothetical protein